MEIFKNNNQSSISAYDSPPGSPTIASMYLQIQKQKTPPPSPEFSNLRPRRLNRSTIARSVSEDFYSKPAFTPSPNSILTPHLRTILSGKEFNTDDLEEVNDPRPLPPPPSPAERKVNKKGRGSKSLTSLECEELKGFMDLGFVFTEKDKDSRLVSILPGLQRLGKTEEKRKMVSPRPKGEGKSKAVNPLMNLRVSIGNEAELKDSLRLWAHSVASTVR
ncbi:hypothetical protein LINPERPRIM_LOCUS34180 [Linum perenne]